MSTSTMNYDLALKLKNAGFPQEGKDITRSITSGGSVRGIFNTENELKDGLDWVLVPTITELIYACGRSFRCLEQSNFISGGYIAYGVSPTMDVSMEERVEDNFVERTVINSGNHSTPEIAVANLWLELNKK